MLGYLLPTRSLLLIVGWIFQYRISGGTALNDLAAEGLSTKNISGLLDSLLEGYDYHLRPGVGGPATQVLIDIEVRSMGPVSEVDMSYSMDCYFRQSWVDRRLAYTSTMPTLALSISMLERIWRPDTYFYNGKNSYLHTITTPNKFVRLYRDGRVLYSSRLTIRASCPMKLENFPMDVQRCPLQIGSFGYSERDIQYKWNPARSVVIASDMKLSMFDVTDTPTGNLTERQRKGPFSVLMVSFHLKRHMGYFIIEVYAPCTMLVVLSWVAFWINREATADRVALGVTTVLTMTFLGLECRNNLPKVPYCTALDYYVAISFGFIFATIIQFAIVHHFTKVGSGEYYFPPTPSDSEEEEEEMTTSLKPGVTFNSTQLNKISIFCTEEATQTVDASETTPTAAQQSSSSDVVSTDVTVDFGRTGLPRNGRLASMRQKRSLHDRRKSYLNRRGSMPHFQLNSVSKVDKASRVIFPVIFLFINLIYWFTYLSGGS
ncbi:gamma-aminobutyric acid receptor alpha-like [Uloborus diversus]|uniref:gamma-aminobutyric acid receptor alpha-like n=1 Tax=Uloborus diversus TaxID=327109 RepID=UPI00240A2D34|nr:gamma-aminobutyric acid receptor alpha-like [Uloborus diversus]